MFLPIFISHHKQSHFIKFLRYDNFTLKHSYLEKGFLYGISDLIAVLESKAVKPTTASVRSTTENKFSTEKMDHVIVPLSIHDRNVTLKKLKDSLSKCLEHVMIKIHNDIYERMNGILQGSICSRNLCDLYLGKIENGLFYYADGVSQQIDSVFELNARMKLVRANEIVLRVVDDYLVIGSQLGKRFWNYFQKKKLEEDGKNLGVKKN